MKIGITGATGQLGRLVISKLKTKISPNNLTALVRSVPKAADLGIEVREADYEKPETLDSALKGTDTLLLISGSEVGKRALQHGNIIAAAKKAKVKWIIYTSLLHADKSLLSLAAEHVATEEALKKSGIPYTLLRNGWYTENYDGSIRGAITTGVISGSTGEGRIASAARADYAEAAVVVLTTPGHQGKVYELAGDIAWTFADLATEISRISGKEVSYKYLSVGEYAQELKKSFGLPDGVAEFVAEMDVAASKDALFDDGRQLSKLIGRSTTQMPDTVAEVLRVQETAVFEK
jgi:NAD(P)H dehydrogenase (quinone)